MPSSPPEIYPLIDTAEQLPYDLPGGVRENLETGDYTDRDLRHLLTIERKSTPDLLQCVGRERARFERCLERMAEYRWRFLVVEEAWGVLAGGLWACPSTLHPNSVAGSLVAWAVRYGVQPWFVGSRADGARVVWRLLVKTKEQALREGLGQVQP